MTPDLKNRVFGAGHRIMTALGVVAGALVALGQYLDYIPPEYRTNKWYGVALALAALGAALKKPGADAAKVATGVALVLFCGLAGAQETQPAAAPTAPLAVQLSPDLSLRLNVSIVAGSYDLTHKAWLGQAPITGLYALTSKRLLDAGIAAGGSLTFDSASRPSGEINAGLVSPKLSISPALALHAAVLYGRKFGPDAASLIRVAPTLEF